MQLHDRILEGLAEMVAGDNSLFPYRSSYYLTKFFQQCDMPYQHDGRTRRFWVLDILRQLNVQDSANDDLPSEPIQKVIYELLDPFEFDHKQLQIPPAVESLNKLLSRHGLSAFIADDERCYLRNNGTGKTATVRGPQPPLSKEEIANRERVVKFLESASEDDLTEKLLVPLFQRLGYRRVSRTGHTEKTLEFGKDLWMKFQLPTGHWLYFSAQIKRNKIDASGASGADNVAEVMTQVKMALDYPIFDPETNRKVLPDHVYVIAAGEITRAAQNWMESNLDASQLRQIILMDRNEFLEHSARIVQDLPLDDETSLTDEDIPF